MTWNTLHIFFLALGFGALRVWDGMDRRHHLLEVDGAVIGNWSSLVIRVSSVCVATLAALLALGTGTTELIACTLFGAVMAMAFQQGYKDWDNWRWQLHAKWYAFPAYAVLGILDQGPWIMAAFICIPLAGVQRTAWMRLKWQHANKAADVCEGVILLMPLGMMGIL